MVVRLGLWVFGSAMLLAGCAADAKSNDAELIMNSSGVDQIPTSVGTASMSEDGIITLRLVGVAEHGMVVRAVKKYAPGSKDYEDIRRHLGGIEIGEVKPIPPWN